MADSDDDARTHLDAVRAALRRARKNDVPSELVARYEAEVKRLEAWVADGAPVTPESVRGSDLDDLTATTLRYHLARDAKGRDPELDELVGRAESARKAGEDAWEAGDESEAARLASVVEALVHEIADLAEDLNADEADEPATVSPDMLGLPLLRPKSGESEAWADVFERWAEILADRWRLQSRTKGDPYDEREAIGRYAEARGWSRGHAKLVMARLGLARAAASIDEPWAGRIGRGLGAGNVEDVVPGEANVGGLQWLAQEGLSRARAALRAWAVDALNARRVEADPDAFGGDAPDPFAGPDGVDVRYRKAAQEVEDLIDRQRRRETRETIAALLGHLETGITFEEAVAAVAAETGRAPESIERALRRIGEREERPTE